MAWRYHGHARTDRRNPSAYAVCDRCSQWWNHSDLQWQFDYVGPRLQNLRILVCNGCLDKPSEQKRPIVVPPDPVPIKNPRPDLFAPIMPWILCDSFGNSLYDTTGQPNGPVLNTNSAFLLATSQQPQPPPTQGDYGYYLDAPDGGGRVLQIPD